MYEHQTREFSKTRHSHQLGEYIFSSGIACLPTGNNAPNTCQYYTHRPKDERSLSKDLSASTRMVQRKFYQGDSNLIKQQVYFKQQLETSTSPYRRCQSAGGGYISVQNKRKPQLTGIIHLPIETDKSIVQRKTPQSLTKSQEFQFNKGVTKIFECLQRGHLR